MSEQKQNEVPWWRSEPDLGARLFEENRKRNAELLRQYEGKIVAWFPDGSGIRDADADSIALWQRIKASGDDANWYRYEYSEPRRTPVEGKSADVPWWRNDPWLGAHLFAANRNHNCSILLQYDGKIVAWFPDGSGIRDADEDVMALRKRIETAGEDPDWYCYEYFSTAPHL